MRKKRKIKRKSHIPKKYRAALIFAAVLIIVNVTVGVEYEVLFLTSGVLVILIWEFSK